MPIFAQPGMMVIVALVAAAISLPGMAHGTANVQTGKLMLEHGHVQYELSEPETANHDGLVVLVAGFSVPMSVWNATVPALRSTGFAVLRFDLYGRGGSARPRVDYNVDLFADQIWQVLTAPQIQPHVPRKVHMVASSMGGPIAARFVNRHPHMVERMVLVSPAGLPVPPPVVTTLLRVPGLGDWAFHAQFRQIMLDHLRENVAANVCSYPVVLADVKRQLGVPGTAHAMLSTLRHLLIQDFTDEFRALGRHRLPTLSVWGNRDELLPADTDKKLNVIIPQLLRHRIRDAGHLPQLERPRLFNARVIKFLSAKPDGDGG